MVLLLRAAVGAALIMTPGLLGAAAAAPADTQQVLKHREALMKGQGADLGVIKGYMQGKADQAKAEAAAAKLTKSLSEIPSVFPEGTGQPSPDGKFKPKPEVWTNWDKFLSAQKTAEQKAEALQAAVKSGDKNRVAAEFADLGKNGCGGCHQAFREKLKD